MRFGKLTRGPRRPFSFYGKTDPPPPAGQPSPKGKVQPPRVLTRGDSPKNTPSPPSRRKTTTEQTLKDGRKQVAPGYVPKKNPGCVQKPMKSGFSRSPGQFGRQHLIHVGVSL